jgi:hypothetical protein
MADNIVWLNIPNILDARISVAAIVGRGEGHE